MLIVEGPLRELAKAVLAEDLPALAHHFYTRGADGAGSEFDTLLASGGSAPLEVEVRDRDVVQLLYSSGTTSNPKGVLTSHLAVTMAGLTGALSLQGGPGYTSLVALPCSIARCSMVWRCPC